MTVSGAGAFLGLAKVTNAGEISAGAAVADSITYQVSDLTETTMTLDINFGGGWWRFKLVSADYEAPSDVSVTFQVDMSAETAHEEGVYLAGGAFGQDGHLMTEGADNVWSVTLELAPDTQYLYKTVTSQCFWHLGRFRRCDRLSGLWYRCVQAQTVMLTLLTAILFWM